MQNDNFHSAFQQKTFSTSQGDKSDQEFVLLRVSICSGFVQRIPSTLIVAYTSVLMIRNTGSPPSFSYRENEKNMHQKWGSCQIRASNKHLWCRRVPGDDRWGVVTFVLPTSCSAHELGLEQISQLKWFIAFIYMLHPDAWLDFRTSNTGKLLTLNPEKFPTPIKY